MCLHKWIVYTSPHKNNGHYQICEKCGLAREINYCGYDEYEIVVDPYLCKTNEWVKEDPYTIRG